MSNEDKKEEATPEQKEKEQKEKERRGRQQEIDDIRSVLNTQQGKRFFARILDFTGPSRTPYHPSGSQSNFNMGMQNVGLWLTAEALDAAPEKFIEMMKTKGERNA